MKKYVIIFSMSFQAKHAKLAGNGEFEGEEDDVGEEDDDDEEGEEEEREGDEEEES